MDYYPFIAPTTSLGGVIFGILHFWLLLIARDIFVHFLAYSLMAEEVWRKKITCYCLLVTLPCLFYNGKRWRVKRDSMLLLFTSDFLWVPYFLHPFPVGVVGKRSHHWGKDWSHCIHVTVSRNTSVRRCFGCVEHPPIALVGGNDIPPFVITTLEKRVASIQWLYLIVYHVSCYTPSWLIFYTP